MARSYRALAVLLTALVLCCHPLTASEPVSSVEANAANEAVSSDPIHDLVLAFNPPETFSPQAMRAPEHAITNGFTGPATDLAVEIQAAAWFSFLVFLPFLIIPNVVLFYVIWRFRDRGDGRKPATFLEHHRLEIIWTLIPVVALIIVAIPLSILTYRTDLAPIEAQRPGAKTLTVEVIARQFSWIWEYPEHGISLALDEAGMQQPMVLSKDRITSLHLRSADVNHAWAVPAFAVKKDCYFGRSTYLWFTPTIAGTFKGQCYELCGSGHALMLFSVIVLEEEQFQTWLAFQRERSGALPVLDALATAIETPEALAEAVKTYLAADPAPIRREALRYWVARDFYRQAEALRSRGAGQSWAAPALQEELDRILLRGHDIRIRLDDLIARVDSNAASPAFARAVE